MQLLQGKGNFLGISLLRIHCKALLVKSRFVLKKSYLIRTASAKVVCIYLIIEEHYPSLIKSAVVSQKVTP